MSNLSLPLLLFSLLSLSIPPAQPFTEHIWIWRILAHKKEDPAKEARLEFLREMEPLMDELKRVQADLAEMKDRLMREWERKGWMEPSAVLAHAMIMARQREENPERKAEGREGVAMLNTPIHDFLYQNDILLDTNQSRAMLEGVTGQGRQRRVHPQALIVIEAEEEEEGREKRQAQTGRNFPQNQWDPHRPISFYFDQKLEERARRAVRLAVQFWTEHTCLSFQENGPSLPRVRIFSGGGCYSQVGRSFRQQEQIISLGRGCEQFGIAAHELGHTMGFFHGHARADRDQFVNVVYSNLSPQMATQFVKQSPEDNNNFGVTYDYGSIMHYSDTDSTTSRVTMLARERMYQHTMGSNVGPSFLDVLEMNLYYKCIDRCAHSGATCQNGGYRHPRDCSKCLCPDGFGEDDCSERAPPVNGAPADCGGDLEAREGEFQGFEGTVTSSVPDGLADRHAQCWWHIRAPSGKRVQLRVKSVSGACSDGCFYGGTELKTKDFVRVGARVCCRSDIRPLGILYSQSELAMVSVFSQYKTQKFSIEFRAVDPSKVPRSLTAEYDDLDGIREPETGTTNQQGGGRKVVAEENCRDVAGNCFNLLHLCDNTLYRQLMVRQCAKSCLRCKSGEKGDTGQQVTVADCGRDHESCPTWAKNGFCRSQSYSQQIKRQVCPRQCRFC